VPSERGIARLLEEVARCLPGGAEKRPGQVEMAERVSTAIDESRHLVVQAGAGTGKSLAYLLAAVQSGRRVVVATATKALQDQLAHKDLPFLAAQSGPRNGFTFAVLKGRSNYLCRQRLAEVSGRSADAQMFDEIATHDEQSSSNDEKVDLRSFGPQVRRILDWSERSASGDRSELDFEPHPRVWAALSVGARECPGAYRCPCGPVCFAERARALAAASDIVVVNTHLYATHVASDNAVLPDHEVLVFDEAHAVEDIMTAGLGVELSAGRLRAIASAGRGLLGHVDAAPADALSEVADQIDAELQSLLGMRVLIDHVGAAGAPDDTTRDGELKRLLALARGRVESLVKALRHHGDSETGDGEQDGGWRTRAVLSAGHLLEELLELETAGDDHVAWVEAAGPAGRIPTLRLAPAEVGLVLEARLWPRVTAVLTSATVPLLLEETLGLPKSQTDRVDVGSPFPYERCALLYCPTDLPDRRSPGAETAVQAELHRLIVAAGGRTLALFTSWRAMEAAVEALRPRLEFMVLAQNDLPKPRLLELFNVEESACLFATMSFWQGVDVPGTTLSVVAIDRLPFPRPDDPLMQARRERAGDGAFRLVDLPRAAMLLAQAAGRLIRSAADTGLVAVLDRRLATASYGRTLRAGLPPMRFTTRREEALAFLASIRAASVPPLSAQGPDPQSLEEDGVGAPPPTPRKPANQ
jgi:ATP-dependent DNA helicase DinG